VGGLRVYVETNFLIEIVLQQAEAASCELLLRSAERGTLDLVVPSLALFEQS
jgi:hypothetical protein